MPLQDWKWLVLDEAFPGGLVTNLPATALKPGQTPNAYNLDPTALGYMETATQPSCDSPYEEVYTIDGTEYKWLYSRLWRFSGTELIYNAPWYVSSYFAQNNGSLELNQLDADILDTIPLGQDKIAVFSTSGGVIISNANSQDARFDVSQLIENVSISESGRALMMYGTVYYSNSNGFYSINQNLEVTELSIPIRDDISAGALTADFNKKLINIGTAWTFDVVSNKFFRYGDSMLYDTRELRSSDGAPISVNEVGFELTNSTEETTLTFQVKYESRDWSTEYQINMPYERGYQERVSLQIEPDTGRSFQLRLVGLPAGIKIKRIFASVSGYTEESRPS